MDLPLSSCSLSLVSITGSPSLSVSFQRSALDRMSVENVVVTMEGISLTLTREGQSISGQRVQLPYKDHSIQIEMVGSYIKCSSIMGFSLLWDQNNAITVKLDPKFHTKTTGLCGDFNGIADDFYFNGDLRSESDYTLMNKLNSLELCSQEPQQTNSYLSREYCLNKTQHIENLLQDELLSCLSVMNHQLKSLLIHILLSDICRLDCNGTAGLYPCDGCATIAEFSRRCTQANGSPGTWRSAEFCGVTCPRGQVHRECGSVCKDTCSNPSASVNCPSTCVDGCFCPEGMVWDDVSGSGCIPQSNCGCNQLGHSYASGESLITGCKNCTCEQGQWNCDSRPCYGTCKILGGSYFSTFDSKTYRFHGDCFYTLTTDCTGNKFSVLGELTKCEGRDSKTCLNSVILYIDGIRTVVFKASGDVLVHENKVPLPFVSASLTVVQESSFYLRAETNFGLRLRVQLKPLMQLYITAATAYHNKTCGLCGNFNEVTGDDFTHSGIVDATAATFCNVWKAQATCPDRDEVTMDPCSVYITNNEYAKTHCGLLMDNDGPFSTCHSVVSADEYYMRCKYDTCSCSYPEPCLCAALSAYAYACAAHGVVLVGWRSDICSLDAENCPISHEFSYAAPECGSASCRASREVCRGVRPPPFELPSPSPVEGCVCGAGLYDDEHGVCVLKSDCPCYSEMSGDVIRAGVTVDLHDTQCLCTGGELHCFGLSPISGNTCEGPMTYHNCSDGSSEGSAACQRTCANPHSICYSPGCVSGCVCPGGLLVDHNGNCVSEEQCTCEHNGRHYNPGDTITQLCNKCTCMNAQWSCTSKVCQGLCFVYGEGHHTTFDGKQYVFDGSCQYILSQDSCGNSSGSFRITTENEPCGTTGTTCSKKVHFFVGADELVLTDGTVKGSSLDLPGSPFHVRRMGIYTVVETSLGVTVIWDGHTAVSVHVNPQLKGNVCGLCGDYDGKVANDFVTRTGSVAASAPEFAAGWKESGSGCPDLSRVSDPCTINHHRESWAHKQCSVLKDGVFKQCHNMVEYLPYYTACVRDSCGCDTGGDCHCLCTALASYAQACGSAGVCLRWRTPDLCPLGCDLYNKDEDQCEWHYRECGRGCQRSCTNRNAICTANLPPLEGCYPTCPSDRPFLNESSMTCVEQCDCVSNGTTYKANDKIPSNNPCEICSCTMDGISCTIIPGCPQTTTTITATTTESTTTTSSSTVPPTTISTTSELTTRPPSTSASALTTESSTTGTPSTTSVTTESTTTPPPTTGTPSTLSPGPCIWTSWDSIDYPNDNTPSNDNETYAHYQEKTGHAICEIGVPTRIDCRAIGYEEANLSDTGTGITCEVNEGLLCLEELQDPYSGGCKNYEIRVCCPPTITTPTTIPSTTAPPSTTSITTESTTTPPPTTAPPSTTSITESTTTPPTTTPPSNTSITTESTTTPPPTTAPPSTASIIIESTTTRCVWSEWFNSDIPNLINDGDNETFAHIRESGTDICPMSYPVNIACQVVGSPDLTFPNFAQNVTCDVSTGLLCLSKDNFPLCKDYQIRVCCNPITTTPFTVSSTTIQSTESPSTTVTFQPSSKSSATTSITYKPTTVTTTVTLPTTTVTSISTKTPTKSSSTTPSKSTINTSPQTPTCPPCKTPVKPVCENKALPQLIKKGCCEEYECPCFCKGWGDPHFLTFGGNKYDFQGVCQYVLVQQINGSGIDWNFHFKVLIDTYDCGARDGVSCPQNLTISYEQYKIRLERRNNTTNVKVLLNGIITQTPYKIPGNFSIDYTGITLTVNFEKINSRITFDGQLFVIVLSHAIFGNKTEGQCGKCSNVPSNDCRLPSGVPVSCAAMAGAWNTTTCRNPASPTTTPTHCPSQPCDILKSSLFADCNKILSPDIYYDSCVFDKCAQNTSNAACASIKAYSKECEKFGFCIPWRENTNGTCDITCPEGRVYHQCSTTFDKSCNLKDIPDINISNRTYEGCFCPEGEFLFTSTDPSMKESLCVSDCGCAGSNGERKKLNEVWDSDCNVCECNAGTRSVVCKPRACPPLGYNNCAEPGWAIRNPSDACCPECMRVCLYDGIRYPVSAKVPSMDCSTCECTNETDDATKFNKITCEKIICNQTCQTGYEYVDQQGACCECRKINCTFNMSGRVILLQPGETVQDPQDNCTTLHCDSINGGPIESTQTIQCSQNFNSDYCLPGTIMLDEAKCCKTCNMSQGGCRLFNSSKYIFYDACSSVEPVEVVSCEGSCPTYSMYSEQGNSVNHTCKCCRDMKTRPRSTSFLCSNGTRFDATYTFIEECGCKEFACDRSARSIADDLGLDYPHRNHLVRKRALRAQANP